MLDCAFVSVLGRCLLQMEVLVKGLVVLQYKDQRACLWLFCDGTKAMSVDLYVILWGVFIQTS